MEGIAGVREKVRSRVMHELDMTDEIRDEDVSSLIDRCIIHEMAGEYIPLKEKLTLKSEIFNSIRRMDVLSDLLQDDEITEIMINGHGLSGLDMVQNISFSKRTYIQHGSSTSSNVRIRAIRTYTPYCACLK